MDIQIEQHAFVSNGDEKDLFEITHLTLEDLEELRMHITASSESSSSRLTKFYIELRSLLYSLDTRRAS